MTNLEAILLGIIQGLTEFLPVSSSGHLTLAQSLFGFKDLENYIIFDVVCHLGTLLAIFCIFRKQIIELCSDKTRLAQIALATLLLFPLVLILKPIKSLFDNTQLLGFFFLLTAGILYAGIRLGNEASPQKLTNNRWWDAIFIGLFQAIAIIPGVSRSGATISAARMRGWSAIEAINFSFLLAIPAILGATAIELISIWKGHPTANVQLSQYAFGFVTSFIFGLFALILLKNLAVKHKFMYFVWYCLVLGIATAVYYNM